MSGNFESYYPPRPKYEKPEPPPPGALNFTRVMATMLPIWAVAVVVFLWRTATETAPYHEKQEPSGLWDAMYALGALGAGLLALLFVVFLLVLVAVRLWNRE